MTDDITREEQISRIFEQAAIDEAIDSLARPVLLEIAAKRPIRCATFKTRYPVVFAALRLLWICHPYASMQEVGWLELRDLDLPIADTKAVIRTATRYGRLNNGFSSIFGVLLRKLGAQSTVELLQELHSQSTKESDQHSVRVWISVFGHKSYERFRGEDCGQSSLTSKAQQALKIFFLLAPFGSQVLAPEHFELSRLKEHWECFRDNLSVRVFAAAFAALQVHAETRSLVLQQIAQLDPMLAHNLMPNVEYVLRKSPVHLSDKDLLHRHDPDDFNWDEV
ncbi:MAG: hypothetical protein ACK58L_02430 [Planctomycetota bacterium]